MFGTSISYSRFLLFRYGFVRSFRLTDLGAAFAVVKSVHPSVSLCHICELCLKWFKIIEIIPHHMIEGCF